MNHKKPTQKKIFHLRRYLGMLCAVVTPTNVKFGNSRRFSMRDFIIDFSEMSDLVVTLMRLNK